MKKENREIQIVYENKGETAEALSDALSGIGDDLIRDAEDNVPVAVKSLKEQKVKRFIAIAVAAVLVLTLIPLSFVPLFSASSGKTTKEDKNTMVISGSEFYTESEKRSVADLISELFTGKPMTSTLTLFSRSKEGAPEDAECEHFPDAPAPAEKSERSEGESWDIKPATKDSEMISGEVTEEITSGDAEEDESSATKEALPDPGQLTAGAWDDNTHYGSWKELFANEGQSQAAGKFLVYTDDYWNMVSVNRVKVTLTNAAGEPVRDARVTLSGSDGYPVAEAVSTAQGIAYLFINDTEAHTDGVISVNGVGVGGPQVYEYSGAPSMDLTVAAADLGAGNALDLLYVVDATGSMGDEIRYLQAELTHITETVAAENPELKIRLGLIFYRDHVDEEAFVIRDFQDVSSDSEMKKALKVLKSQVADGGGDYEEAVDEALQYAMGLSWETNSTKVLFHVLDAPAHNTEEVKNVYSKAVFDAAAKGIRICPVVSSGADSLTEFTCRTEAILTGGHYIYLTDDSGIGGGHEDPELPAVIEYLDALMIRLVNGYLTGTFADPVPWKGQ